jgi:hypothetical protein
VVLLINHLWKKNILEAAALGEPPRKKSYTGRSPKPIASVNRYIPVVVSGGLPA